MTGTERMFKELEKQSRTIASLCAYIGVKSNVIANWKSQNTIPPAKYLVSISEFLNITVEYLLTGETKNSPDVEPDERELLTYYNDLTDKEQGMVLERARTLSDLHKQAEKGKNKQAKNIYIEYYNLPASAGTGVDLCGDDKEMLEVESTPMTEAANFALTVRGNSMEPRFYNDDTVLIRTQPAVEVGEIGIFILNGEGYIKKFGGDRLISLNPDYEDIIIGEYDNCCCRGKVIGKL